MPDLDAAATSLPPNPVREIHVDHITKRFGRTPALDELSLTLQPGVTGLLGPNGAGKTTFIRILATVLAPDSGQIRYGHLTPSGGEALHEIRSQLGYAPQEPGFYPNFSVFQFIDYVAILKEMTERRARHDEVRRVISLVGLDDVASKPIRKLSGGMRRRTALAQALLGRPTLVVLDEPTAGLDPEQRLRFRELLSKRLPHQIVLLSTHQTEDVTALCQRVVVVDRGRTRFDGTPASLAATAEGRVWLSDRDEPTAALSWVDGLGRHRHIGEPPPGSEVTEPTLEDGYLLLVGHHPDRSGDHPTGPSDDPTGPSDDPTGPSERIG
jgi:ABC-2 type transport system ATP-binding protein